MVEVCDLTVPPPPAWNLNICKYYIDGECEECNEGYEKIFGICMKIFRLPKASFCTSDCLEECPPGL